MWWGQRSRACCSGLARFAACYWWEWPWGLGGRQLLRCLPGLEEERLIMEDGWEVHMGTEIIFSSFLSFLLFWFIEAGLYASNGFVVSTCKPDFHQLYVGKGDRAKLMSSERVCSICWCYYSYAELAFRKELSLPFALTVCFSSLPWHLRAETVSLSSFPCADFPVFLV